MASCTAVSGLVFLCFGTLLSIISLAAPNWVESKHSILLASVEWGFWQYCMDNECKSLIDEDVTEKIPSWMEAARVLFSMGMVGGVGALFLAICHNCVVSCRDSLRVLIPLIAVLIFAFSCLLIPVVLMAVKKDDHPFTQFMGQLQFGWAFFMGMAAATCMLISALMYMCNVSESRHRGYQYIPPREIPPEQA